MQVLLFYFLYFSLSSPDNEVSVLCFTVLCFCNRLKRSCCKFKWSQWSTCNCWVTNNRCSSFNCELCNITVKMKSQLHNLLFIVQPCHNCPSFSLGEIILAMAGWSLYVLASTTAYWFIDFKSAWCTDVHFTVTWTWNAHNFSVKRCHICNDNSVICVSYTICYVCLQDTAVNAASDQPATPSVCFLFHTVCSYSFLLVYLSCLQVSGCCFQSVMHMCTCVQGEIFLRHRTHQPLFINHQQCPTTSASTRMM